MTEQEKVKARIERMEARIAELVRVADLPQTGHAAGVQALRLACTIQARAKDLRRRHGIWSINVKGGK